MFFPQVALLNLVLVSVAVFVTSVNAQPASLMRVFESTQSLAINAAGNLSNDGRVFAYTAGGLGSSSGRLQVYLFDSSSQTSTLVSRTPSGSPGNSDSYSPFVSGDGSLVAFMSEASDLVSGDTNSNLDLFLYNVGSASVSKVSNLTGDDSLYTFSFSNNGRFLAYRAYIDAEDIYKVFVFDNNDQSTASILANSSYNRFVYGISDDGNLVLYGDGAGSGSSSSFSVNIFNRSAATVTRVDTNARNVAPNSPSYEPIMTPDGKFVAFISSATNLVEPDTNEEQDVFLKNVATGAISRVSQSVDGKESNGYSYGPRISNDGRFVVFVSEACNLVFGDSNNRSDVFLYDVRTGGLKFLSSTKAGVQGNKSSYNAVISGNGNVFGFVSSANNLVDSDTNSLRDLFYGNAGIPVIKDECYSDISKLTPGICGCGLSDADTNSNGLADCLEPDGNTIPTTPALLTALKGKKVKVDLPAGPVSGTTYRVIATNSSGSKVYFRKTVKGNFIILNLKGVKGIVKVFYRFVFPGGLESQLSPEAHVSVKAKIVKVNT